MSIATDPLTARMDEIESAIVRGGLTPEEVAKLREEQWAILCEGFDRRIAACDGTTLAHLIHLQALLYTHALLRKEVSLPTRNLMLDVDVRLAAKLDVFPGWPRLRQHCRELYGVLRPDHNHVIALCDWLHVRTGLPMAEVRNLDALQAAALVEKARGVAAAAAPVPDADHGGRPGGPAQAEDKSANRPATEFLDSSRLPINEAAEEGQQATVGKGDTSAGSVKAPILDDEDVRILNALDQNPGLLLTQVEIETRSGVSRRTVSARMSALLAEGLAEQPRGPRGGTTITELGRQVVASISRAQVAH
jgi:hypothetical protein